MKPPDKNMQNRIEAAREYAAKEVREFIATEPDDSETMGGSGPVAYTLWWCLNLSWADGPNGGYINVSLPASKALCYTALINADVRQLVCEIIATRINNGMLLDEYLREFAFLALLDRLPKPKTKPGKPVSKNFERDMFLIRTLEEIQKNYNLSPTHNDGYKNCSPQSGAKIISSCFCSEGRHEVTSRAIKDVWFNKNKRKWAKQISQEIENYQPPSKNAFADMLKRIAN